MSTMYTSYRIGEGEGSEILIILVLGLHLHSRELLIKEEELRRRSLLGSTRSFILKSHTHRAFVLFALVAKNYSHEFFRFERHKNG